jgi:hypothetical protein
MAETPASRQNAEDDAEALFAFAQQCQAVAGLWTFSKSSIDRVSIVWRLLRNVPPDLLPDSQRILVDILRTIATNVVPRGTIEAGAEAVNVPENGVRCRPLPGCSVTFTNRISD